VLDCSGLVALESHAPRDLEARERFERWRSQR
jgi:hypothetical protein